MEAEIEPILKKMCELVKADYDSINFKEDRWFMKYQWTSEQEKEFKVWFIEYLKKNKSSRKFLMKRPSTHRKSLIKVVDEFLSNYGWSVIQAVQ